MKCRNRLSILILLGIFLFCLSGCSYAYDLYLHGRLLRGPNRSPVRGATVTLFAGAMDYATCSTNKQGKWNLKHSLSDSEFWPDANGKRWLRINEENPYQIRIKTDGEQFVIPCPRVAVPESGGDIYAFVLAVLDVGDGKVVGKQEAPERPAHERAQ